MKYFTFILAIVLVSCYGCQSLEKRSVKSNKDVVTRFFEEAYNRKNYQYVMDFFAGDYFEHRDHGARTNQDAFNVIRSAEQAFPDLTVKIEDLVEEGDLIAVRLTFNATHKATFLGIEATNKNISWEAMEFFRIKNGMITESWGSWPLYDMTNMLTSK